MEEKIHLLISGYFIGSLTESEIRGVKRASGIESGGSKNFRGLPSALGRIGTKSDVETHGCRASPGEPLSQGSTSEETSLFQIMMRAASVIILAVIFSSTYIYFHNTSTVTNSVEHIGMMQEISAIFGTRGEISPARRNNGLPQFGK